MNLRVYIVLVLILLATAITNAATCADVAGNNSGGEAGFVNNDLTLTANIENINGTCFVINASNIIIDGGGFKIVGNGTGRGLENSSTSRTNITIKNFAEIRTFSNGIFFRMLMNETTIFNNSIVAGTSTNDHGIHLLRTNSAQTFEKMNISNNEINVSGSGAEGIFIESTSGADIILNAIINNNTIRSTGNNGITVEEFEKVNVTYNNIRAKNRGIKASENSTIANNIIDIFGSLSANTGIGVDDDTEIISNTITVTTNGTSLASTVTGILLAGAGRVNISHNVINMSGNFAKGIDIGRLTGSSWEDNILSNNITLTGNNTIGIYGAPDFPSTALNISNNIINISRGTAILIGSAVNPTVNPSTIFISFNNITIESGRGINIENASASGAGTLPKGPNFIGFNNITFKNVTTAILEAKAILLTNVNNTNVSDNIINLISRNSYGIFIEENISGSAGRDSFDINITKNNITSYAQDSYGIFINATTPNSSLLNMNASLNTILMHGDNSTGIYYRGANHSFILENTINMTATGSRAIYIETSNYTVILANNITNNGTNSPGVIVRTSFFSNLTSNNINTTGNNSYGISLNDSSNNNISKNIVLTSGINASALRLDNSDSNTFLYDQLNASNGAEIYSLSNSTDNNLTNLMLLGLSNITTTEIIGVSIDINTTPPVQPAGAENTSDFFTITNVSANGYINFNVSYNQSELDTTSEDDLLFYEYDEDTTSWTAFLNSTVDIDNNVVISGNITSFSTWGVLAASCASIAGNNSGGTAGFINNDLTLTQNIKKNKGTCFVINASNIIIDGGGFKIVGNGTFHGFNNTGALGVNTDIMNVTIRNFAGIINFTRGIHFPNRINESTIFNNSIVTANVSSGHGISLVRATAATTYRRMNISNNEINVSGASADGINIDPLTVANVILNILIHNNTIKSDRDRGISTIRSLKINITSNNINSANTGIEGAKNSTIANNTIYVFGALSTNYGIAGGSGLDDSQIISNVITIITNGTTLSSNVIGITIVNQRRVTISENFINMSGNFAKGIDSGSTWENNILLNNITLTGNNSIGILGEEVIDTNISNNRINISRGTAIQFGADYTDQASPVAPSNLFIAFNNITIESGRGINVENASASGPGVGSAGKKGPNFIGFNNITFNNITTTIVEAKAIRIFNTNNTNVSDNIINLISRNSYGIFIDKNLSSDPSTEVGRDSFDINITKNNITSYFPDSYGIFINATTPNSSLLNMNASLNTILMHGDNSTGIYYRGANHSFILENTINMTATGSRAIYIETSNYTIVLANNITNNGTNSPGVIVLNSFFSNLTSNNINTTGNNSYGILLNISADSNNISINNITTAGSGAYGIFLNNNSNSTEIHSNTITTSGSSAYGLLISLFSSFNNLTSNNITTSGLDSYGILINSSLNISIISHNITTSGGNATGIYFQSSSNLSNITDNLITTTGTNATGIYLQDLSDSNIIQSNNITTSGTDSLGLYLASANNINSSKNIVLTSGNSSQALRLDNSDSNTFLYDQLNATNSAEIYSLSNSTDNNLTNIILLGLSNITTTEIIGVSIDINTTPPVQPAGAENTSDFFTITNVSANGYINFSVSYNQSELATNSENNLQLYEYDEDTASWIVFANSSVDTDDDEVISGNITSFSTWGVLSVAPGGAQVQSESQTGTSSTGAGQAVAVSPAVTTAPPAPAAPSAPAVSEVIVTPAQLFVVNNQPVENLALIVSDAASAETQLALVDLLISLQQAGVAGSVVNRETKDIEVPRDSTNINETIGKVLPELKEGDLGILASKEVLGSTSTKAMQFIVFNSSENYTSNKAVFDVNEEKNPGDYFLMKDGEEIFRYKMHLDEGLKSRTSDNNATNATLPDLTDHVIDILGQDYTIVKASVDTTQTIKESEIILMTGDIKSELEENEERYYHVEGKTYKVNVVTIIEDRVYLRVNDQEIPVLRPLELFETKDNLTIGIRDIQFSEKDFQKARVRFFLNAKKVIFSDPDYSDNTDNESIVKVDNKFLRDAKVNLLISFLEDKKKAVINHIVYRLFARSDNGDVYIPEGGLLSEHLSEPEGLLSPNFDLQYKGLTKSEITPIKVHSNARKEYYINFTNQEGIVYELPFATAERDGSLRYGDLLGGTDKNIVFIEGNNSDDYTAYSGDYLIFSDINTSALNLSGGFAEFNNGTQTDNFGFTHILYYEQYDPTNNVLRFTDIGKGYTSTKHVVVNDNDNATLETRGARFIIKVNTTDSNYPISADLNGDGIINGKSSVLATMGGALITLGKSNPKKTSPSSTLDTLSSINFSIVTIGSQFEGGGGNQETVFTILAKAGNKVQIDHSQTQRIPLKSLKDFSNTIISRDGYGAFYELADALTFAGANLTVLYPHSQKNVRVSVVGGEKKTKEIEADQINELPSGAIKLASEIEDISKYNSILIGNACDNAIIAQLFGYPDPCDKGLPDEGSLVQLFNFENKTTTMVIAGKTSAHIKTTITGITKGLITLDLRNATKLSRTLPETKETVEITEARIVEKEIEETKEVDDCDLDLYIKEKAGKANWEIPKRKIRLLGEESYIVIENTNSDDITFKMTWIKWSEQSPDIEEILQEADIVLTPQQQMTIQNTQRRTSIYDHNERIIEIVCSK